MAARIHARTGLRFKTILVDAPAWERAAMFAVEREILKAEAKRSKRR